VLVTEEPELVTEEPELVTEEPETVTEEPELVTEEPVDPQQAGSWFGRNGNRNYNFSKTVQVFTARIIVDFTRMDDSVLSFGF